MGHETPPQWDRGVRERLRGGEAAALAELYDRFAPLAFGIAQRVLDDDAAAGTVTGQVFTRIWQSPEDFDPDRGPMRSWIAAEAHLGAVDLLRVRARQAKSQAEYQGERPSEHGDLSEQVRAASTAARADYIVTAMPAPLREALELTHFEHHDYRLTARHLGITEAETRRRLRLGLQLLSTASEYPAGSAGDAGDDAGEER